MSQYLLLKSDGESGDSRVGLTSDSLAEGGVLGGDNYEAAETSHNNYLELQEANSEYVAIDSSLSTSFSGLTVMAWVRSSDTSGEAIISSHDRSEYYRFNLDSGNFDCSFNTDSGTADINSGVTVADGRWHHLAAVYDSGTIRMYVDGRRVVTNTGNGTSVGSGGTRYGFLGTGSEASEFDGTQGPNSYGNLDISNHRLYLDAKTDTEVEAAFEGNPPTANLHEYLPLTADDAGRLNDASGNGRHGYLRNGAAIFGTETNTALNTFQTTNTTSTSSTGSTQASSLLDQQSDSTTTTTTAAIREALAAADQRGALNTSTFAGKHAIRGGSTPQVEDPDPSGLSSSEITVAARVITGDSFHDWQDIIESQPWGPNGWNLNMNAGGDISWTVRDSDNNFHGVGYSGLDTHTEYHIVGVYDGSDMVIYLDGVEVARSTIGSVTLDDTMGTQSDDQGLPFTLLEFQTYNRGLTSSEVNSISDNPDAISSGKIIDWRFDEGRGNFVHDESGTGNTGTVNGSWIPEPQEFDTNAFGNSSSESTAGGEAEQFTHADQQGSGFSITTPNTTRGAFSVDIFGNSLSDSTADSTTELFTYADQQGSGFSTTTPNITRDAFSADTFGNSSSDSTADGIAELFTQTGQPADLITSSVVDAFTESFDTVERTALGNALTGVTGDTQVATTNTTQSLSNALAEPLVAAETAALTVDDATSFAEAYSDALRASGSGLPTTGSGTTAVTSLGTATLTTSTSLFEQATVEMFAYVSPESATAIPQVGTFDTATKAVALTENAVMVPVTPTMDVIVAVKKGEIGLEGAFSDSLAADVGASTTIKVAHTLATSEVQESALDTSALPDALVAAADALGKTGSFTTQTTAEALAVVAALHAVGSSSSFTDIDALRSAFSGSDVDSDGQAAAFPDAAVRDAVASELDASGNAHAKPEVLAQAAQTLTEQGVADTQTEAAALISQYVAQYVKAGGKTFAGVDGSSEVLNTIDRTGRPSTFTYAQSFGESFTGLSVTSPSNTSVTVQGAVRDAVASALQSNSSAHAEPEVLAQAAQTLTEQGVADTQTEAAALVSQYVARYVNGDGQAFTEVDASSEVFDAVDNDGDATSFSLSDAAQAVFSEESLDAAVSSKALSLISAALVSTVQVNGAASTKATSAGDITDADADPVLALLRFLFAATEGSNTAFSTTEQNVRVTNTENHVEIEN